MASIDQQPSHNPAAPAAPSARRLWFGRYPGGQTFAAFLIAILITAGLTLIPGTSIAYVHSVDPTATGALYIAYEVLLSFAGHTQAMQWLALAALLTLPVRYVYFGRRDSFRPSVTLPAIALAVCMVVGQSYDLMDSAELILAGISNVIEALIQGAGWFLMAQMGIYLIYEVFDWFGARRLPFSESRYGILWRALHVALDRRPFLYPLLLIALAWALALIGSAPGIFMGDTGAQIRQWFNLPNGTSSYLNLINPNVLLNGHHPVAHTALLGSCVQLGQALFHDENAGILIYTTLQFALTVAAVAYMIASLRALGAHLAARSCVLAFFALMPLFPNYAVLITKDVLFADAVLVLVVLLARMLAASRPVGEGSVPKARLRASAAATEDTGSNAAAAAKGPVSHAAPAAEGPRPVDHVDAGEPGPKATAAELPQLQAATAPHPVRTTGPLAAYPAPVAWRGSAGEVVLLLVACLGCTFFRNGGVVFPLAACVLAAAFALAPAVAARRTARAARPCAAASTDAATARVIASADAAPAAAAATAPANVAIPAIAGAATRPAPTTPTPTRRIALPALAVLALTLACHLAFSNLVMPALQITPGSRRETLSIPFQQTARYVQKHDGAHSGVEDGTDDGMVTPEERQVIDRVLGYSDLGSRYDPDKSDAVKNGFNEDATPEDLNAYLHVWAAQLLRDPEAYLSATVNNYYGYLYPSSRNVFFYSTVSSAKVMDRPENREYFDFHPATGALVEFCDHANTLYRVAVECIPLASLAFSSPTYVWLLAIACCYLLRARQWRALALMVPLLGVVAVCLIGPCNGSTYLRYLYPAIVSMPFALVVAISSPRVLWRGPRATLSASVKGVISQTV